MIIGLPLQDYVTKCPPGYWVARALYVLGKSRWYETKFGLLGDRQGFHGELDPKAQKELLRWVNKKALNRLRKELFFNGVSPGDSRLTVIRDAPFYLYADPRASHGYIYLAAWKEAACPSPEKSSEPSTTNPVV